MVAVVRQMSCRDGGVEAVQVHEVKTACSLNFEVLILSFKVQNFISRERIGFITSWELQISTSSSPSNPLNPSNI